MVPLAHLPHQSVLLRRPLLSSNSIGGRGRVQRPQGGSRGTGDVGAAIYNKEITIN